MNRTNRLHVCVHVHICVCARTHPRAFVRLAYMTKSSHGCLHQGEAKNLVTARCPLPPPVTGLEASWRAAGVLPGKLALGGSRGWQYPLRKQPSRPCCLSSGHSVWAACRRMLLTLTADPPSGKSQSSESPSRIGGDHRHSQHPIGTAWALAPAEVF